MHENPIMLCGFLPWQLRLRTVLWDWNWRQSGVKPSENGYRWVNWGVREKRERERERVSKSQQMARVGGKHTDLNQSSKCSMHVPLSVSCLFQRSQVDDLRHQHYLHLSNRLACVTVWVWRDDESLSIPKCAYSDLHITDLDFAQDVWFVLDKGGWIVLELCIHYPMQGSQ